MPRSGSKRMSSAPPVRKLKPRSSAASWKLERPRSNMQPSTSVKPSSGATLASSRKFACRSAMRSPNRGARRARTLAMAAPSASRPRRRPSGLLASRTRSAWPPPPRVASMCRLPATGASIATTSSDMTGTCVAGCSLVIASDPEPADGLGEGRRVVHGLAVGLPALGRPDLAVVADADDQRLGADPHLLAQVRRDQDAALAVHVGLEGAAEDLALEEPPGRIRDGDGRGLLGQEVPAGPRVDGEAAVDPAGQDRASLQLRAKSRRDRESSLLVHRVPVLAGEHPRALPLPEFDRLAGSASRSLESRFRSARPEPLVGEGVGSPGYRGRSPLFPTSHHLGAFSARKGAASRPNFRAPERGCRAAGEWRCRCRVADRRPAVRRGYLGCGSRMTWPTTRGRSMPGLALRIRSVVSPNQVAISARLSPGSTSYSEHGWKSGHGSSRTNGLRPR